MKGKQKKVFAIVARMLAFLLLFGLAFGTAESYAETEEPVQKSLMEKEVPAEDAGASGYVNGELLVVFEESAAQDADEAAEAAQTIAEDTVSIEQAEPVADHVADDGACVLVTLDNGEDMEEAMDALGKEDGIAYVQPNFQYRMLETSAVNDPYCDLQYALDSWDETFRSSCGANVKTAWELMGGAGASESGEDRHVTIAVIDSGCQTTHEDLRAAIDAEHAYDAVTKQVGTEYVTDKSGHGTHVAGIAAGVTDNGTGIAGAAGNYAKILPINVFVGQWSSTKDMVTAFNYLEELITTGELDDLHVINMSLGGYGDLDEDDLLLEKCITGMRNKDVLTVCAGGNGDDQFSLAYKDKLMYPGDYKDCLCVTSLDSDGTNSLFSDFSMDKDISAPGSGIISTMTDSTGTAGEGADAKYGFLSGTSMASPLVAGIIGLLFVDNPDLTCDQAVEAVLATAHKVNPSVNSHEGETGSAGAIDAAAALMYAREKFDTKRVRIQNGDVSVETDTFVFDGEEKKAAVNVVHEGQTLKENIDYLVSYSENVNAGTAHVAVTGIKDFIGTVSREYRIEKADIKDATVTLEPADFLYDGQYHFPTKINASLSGKTLKWGKEFTVDAMTDGISRGSHAISLQGKGNYTGTKTVHYTISGGEVPIESAKVTGIQDRTYNGKTQTQSPVVTVDGKTLAEGIDYTIGYANNKNAGTASVLITGKGDYKGTKTVSFAIKKAVPSISGKNRTANYKKLKKKALSVKAIHVTNAFGNVTYKRIAKASSPYLKVTAKGEIKIAKGTPKGTYKIRVKVTVKSSIGNTKKTKTITVKVRVK